MAISSITVIALTRENTVSYIHGQEKTGTAPCQSMNLPLHSQRKKRQICRYAFTMVMIWKRKAIQLPFLFHYRKRKRRKLPVKQKHFPEFHWIFPCQLQKFGLKKAPWSFWSSVSVWSWLEAFILSSGCYRKENDVIKGTKNGKTEPVLKITDKRKRTSCKDAPCLGKTAETAEYKQNQGDTGRGILKQCQTSWYFQ